MMTEPEQKRASDPLLLNIYNNGHKVIAYPNAHQRSLQQNSLLASKSSEATVGENSIQIPALKPVATRPRSLSASRTRRIGTDLVQDVYDRLGVTRGALVDSADTDHKFPSRLQQMGTVVAAAERGRSREPFEDPAMRTRSWSRGRLRSRWPPATAAANNAEVLSSPKPEVRPLRSANNYETEVLSSKPRSFRGIDDTAVLSPKPRVFRSNSEASHLSPKLRTFRDTAASIYRVHSRSTEWKDEKRESVVLKNSSSEWRDEKKEGDCNSQECDDEARSNVPSVRDRMHAFSGPEANKKVISPKRVDKPYASQFVVREHPPKIDIFGGEKNRESDILDDKDEDVNSGSLGKHLQKHNGKQLTTNESSCALDSPKSLSGKSNHVASAFLAAIQTSPSDKPVISRSYSYAPVTEMISDDQASVAESVAVSMLSSSGSDDQMSPTFVNRLGNKQGNVCKKPSWLERGKRLSGGNKGGPTTTSHRRASPPPSSLRVGTSLSTHSERASVIEKMVDERVRARMNDLERRVEEQMRTFMQQMDAKVASRMADLERSS
jgi:hypothetical protein